MDISGFKRKVYITYKSRINAAERLKNTEKFIQGINIYYSIYLTVLAIYNFINCSTRLSLMITIFTVVVTITIVYLASQKYGERAKDLKNNYISLFELYSSLEQCDTDDKLNILKTNYVKLLDTSENHSEYDYYKAMLSIKDIKKDEQAEEVSYNHSIITNKQKAIFYFQYWGSIILKIVFIFLPIILKYLTMFLGFIV